MKKIALLFVFAPLFACAQFECEVFENILTDPEPALNSYFGRNVITGGNNLAVYRVGDNDEDIIRLYEYENNQITLTQTIILQEVCGPFCELLFGESMIIWSLTSESFFITVRDYPHSKVLNFTKSNGTWTLENVFFDENELINSIDLPGYGASVRAIDDWFFIFQPSYNEDCTDCIRGRIHIFKRENNAWTPHGHILPNLLDLEIYDGLASVIATFDAVWIVGMQITDDKLVVHYSINSSLVEGFELEDTKIFAIYNLSNDDNWVFDKIFWFELEAYLPQTHQNKYLLLNSSYFALNTGIEPTDGSETPIQIMMIPWESISFENGYCSFSTEIIYPPNGQEDTDFSDNYVFHPSNPNLLVASDPEAYSTPDPDTPWVQVESGKLYVYEKLDGSWQLTTEIAPTYPDFFYTAFGASNLGIIDNAIFVGNQSMDYESIVNAGIIHIFSCENTIVSQTEIETLPETSFSLYPNPVQNFVCISGLNANKTYTLKVFSGAGGSLIFEKVVRGIETHTIDMQNFANGLYVIQASTPEKIMVNTCIIHR